MRQRVTGIGAAAALYVALTILLTYPLSVAADRILPADDPDGHLFMWTLAWDAHAFLHQPLAIFDANIFYPLHNSLALSENLIGSAFFAAPVLWVTGNPVLAVNVVSLLSCVLCGLGAYVLGRRVGLSAAASLLTGIIFAFSPPRLFRFSQLHLAAVQWIPFTLASLHAYLDGGRRRDLRLAIAFFTLQVLTSGHGGVFATIAVLLLLTYHLARGAPVRAARRVRDVGVPGFFLLLPIAAVAIPYRVNQVELGLRRVLDTSPTPVVNFFASPTRVDIFLHSLFTSRNLNTEVTAWLFPGYVPAALALLAIVAPALARLRHIRISTAWPACVRTAWPYRRAVGVLAIAGGLWVCFGVAPAVLRAGNGLAPQYYGGDNVAWTGYLSILQPGLYFFSTTSENPSRLTIDDHLVVDNTGGHPSGQAGSIRLDRGPHRVVLDNVHGSGPSSAKWEWVFDGDTDKAYKPIPPSMLSRRPVSYTQSIVVREVQWLRTAAALVAALAALWGVMIWRSFRIDAARTSELSTTSGLAMPLFYLLLTLVCIGLAIGGRYGLWQFVYWLPGFNFIRGESRFMVLGLLGIAVLAGGGFDRLTAHLRPGWRSGAAVLAGSLLVAEFSAIPFGGVPYRLQIPAADRWVAGQPKPFSIAEVPVSTSERYHSNYMLHSTAHWQKTVHGYSGIRPALHNQLYDELRSFPSDTSIQHLARLDVTYVIVHSSWFPPDERARVEERLGAFGSWLKLEYSDADSRVYSVRHPSQKES